MNFLVLDKLATLANFIKQSSHNTITEAILNYFDYNKHSLFKFLGNHIVIVLPGSFAAHQTSCLLIPCFW